MRPDPSNVTGEVIETHQFEHSVHWNVSHVLLVIVALYGVWRLGPVLAGRS